MTAALITLAIILGLACYLGGYRTGRKDGEQGLGEMASRVAAAAAELATVEERIGRAFADGYARAKREEHARRSAAGLKAGETRKANRAVLTVPVDASGAVVRFGSEEAA